MAAARKLPIFPWSDSEDEDMQENLSDIEMSTPASMASASTRLPESPTRAWQVETSGLDERVISETAVASKILWHCVKSMGAMHFVCSRLVLRRTHYSAGQAMRHKISNPSLCYTRYPSQSC